MSHDLSPAWIYVKAVLFLAILLASAALVLLERPSWRVTILLALVAWSSARLYYFLFHVVEKYIDGDFRYAGLFDLLVRLLRRR